MMKKENDFLRIDRNKDKRDFEIVKRQLEMASVKQQIIFKAMLAKVEDLEEENERLSRMQGCLVEANSTISKVFDIEAKLESLFPNEALQGDVLPPSQTWRNKLFEDIEKIDDFERQYVQLHISQKLLDVTPSLP